ncbi:DUF5801 repeats-in-toxin domain-containing protein, partial [Bradyrhizobium sp. Bra78]|uniref:DUF5801 repeats-in-toxin domain-containing protein n=1 Tax=Bradyrhizobium sp. Bra78 TaxID=2926010 RepID=UPI0021C5FE93
VADAGAVTYTLGVVAGASGLVDTLTGQDVILSLVGGQVEGRTAVSSDLVFTVTVDATGNVTLDQLRSVVHPDATNPDDSTTLSAANLITLTATVTDGDLDTNQATLNIGQSLTFLDDGPSISVNEEAPTLTVDETVLATNATASFAGAFTPVFGTDGPLDANHDGVADAGAVTYTLGVVAGASGLVDTLTGQDVILSLVGGQVEGRTAVSSDLVFTVTVDATGNVTLDQLRSVVHPDATNPDDSTTLSAANLITLTATVTDGDLDTNQATLNIGQSLTFLDDGPSITVTTTAAPADALVVDETNLAINATANFADNFSVVSNYGADGAGSIASAYTLGVKSASVDSGLIDVDTGLHVLLVLNGNTVEGHVGPTAMLAFTVTVDAAGVVTLDQMRALQHPDATNPDDTVTLSAADLITLTRADTITDGDGDTATSSSSINIGQALTFHDDGPSITLTTAEPADALVVDETNLAINATADFANNFAVSGSYGADGIGLIASTYTLSVKSASVDSGLIDVATGQHILLVLNG